MSEIREDIDKALKAMDRAANRTLGPAVLLFADEDQDGEYLRAVALGCSYPVAAAMLQGDVQFSQDRLAEKLASEDDEAIS